MKQVSYVKQTTENPNPIVHKGFDFRWFENILCDY